MAYRPNMQRCSSIFAVPTDLADYIPKVSGDQLKVVLYLYRYPERGIDPKHIAEDLKLSETELLTILSFWMKEGFLLTDESVTEQVCAHSVTGKQIAKRLKENDTLRELKEMAEQCYGRPLSSAEQRTVVAMYQNRRLPVDVIVMLIAYCVDAGKTSPQYLDTLAKSWADEGIVTLELAEQRLQQMQDQKTISTQIKKAFGLGNRALSKKEEQYITTWTETYGFDMPMILAAYEKTVDTIGKCSFAYINTILGSWHSKGYKTPEDIADEQSNHKTSSRIRREPSYQTEQLDKLGLQVPPVKVGAKG